MSWIFGMFAAGPVLADVGRWRSIHPPALHRIEDGPLYLAAGGLPETCLAGVSRSRQGEERWIVIGLPMQSAGGGVRFLSSAEISERLSREEGLDDLDGHYLLATWSSGRLICRSDPLGLRTLYVAEVVGGTILSTRLDWLARAVGGLSLDFAAFGSHWLGDHQYSHRSLVTGATRLPPGGVLICTAGEARLEETPSGRLVIDASSPTSPGELSDILHPFLHPKLPDARSISLALSGGLDSRTLLALLMRDARQFGVHIFGDDADPDAEIATRIARDVGLREKRFPTRLDAHDWAVASLIEYSAHANATAPASTVARLCAYPQLYADGLVSIDGFFGEIARRSYHKRVAAMGPSAMDARAAELLRFLSSPRPAIFNGDTMNRMREGFREDVEGMIAEFRSVAGRRLEDFLDLAAVRFRLPNFAGYEQARLDGQAVTYMPFAQPSALRGLLRLPLRDRRGGRAFRQAIRRYAPRLTAYPLVKGGVTYPFHLGPSLAWLWTAARRRLGNYYRDPAPAAYLRSIETFVRDTIRSHEVRTYSAYDYDAIQHAVESFYAGDDAFTGFVDWWLAFEMWRAGLSGR